MAIKQKKQGRNAPCQCGSGEKYKKCCLITKNPPLPQRPREHEIDTEAVRHIEQQLPAAWTTREQKADYGKDIWVEIFVSGLATSNVFHIQSKGKEKFKLVRDQKIALPIPISTLNYLEGHVAPSMIVVYSVAERRACYLWVRPYIQTVLDKQDPTWRNTAGDSTITLHIPYENVLDLAASASIHQYVETMRQKMLHASTSVSAITSTFISITHRPTILSARLNHPNITQLLSRPLLADKIWETVENQTVFLHADAGYGKTWLVHEIATTFMGESFIWYTFDSGVRDSTQFLKELVQGFHTRFHVGDRTLTYLFDNPEKCTVEEATALFIDELVTGQKEMLMIVEDIHLATTEMGIVLQQLVKNRPNSLKILLTSRSPLPFPTAKLMSERKIKSYDHAAIAFTDQDVELYARQSLGLPLTVAQMQKLLRRTGNWIAALALAFDAVEGRSESDVLTLLERMDRCNDSIYDFFAEEVYSQKSADVQHLLKRISLIHRIDNAVVNRLTQFSDGGLQLRTLSRHNTFLHPDSQQHYKLHTLFADFLKMRFLEEEGLRSIKSTHADLALYYQEIEEWITAIEHGIKGENYKIATESLEQVAATANNLGYSRMILEFAGEIPIESLRKSAETCEAVAIAAFQTSNFSTARTYLKYAKESLGQGRDVDAARLKFLDAELQYQTKQIELPTFVAICEDAAAVCYTHNEYLVGCQIELRIIDSRPQLLAWNRDDSIDELSALERQCFRLVQRVESLGKEFQLIHAKALALQAHLQYFLLFLQTGRDVDTFEFRSMMGFGQTDAISDQLIYRLIRELPPIQKLIELALTLAQDNKLHQAFIQLRYLRDQAGFLSSLKLRAKMKISSEIASEQLLNVEMIDQLQGSFLQQIEACRQVFVHYHTWGGVVGCYCIAAKIYNSLGQLERQKELATEALSICINHNLARTMEEAQQILDGYDSFSHIFAEASKKISVGSVATWDEEFKRGFTLKFLRLFGDDVDEMRRQYTMLAVEEMSQLAQQRLTYCKHLYLIEDMQHEQSLDTFYRQKLQKRIVCKKLGGVSREPKESFVELLPFFKAVYCLGCSHRAPNRESDPFDA